MSRVVRRIPGGRLARGAARPAGSTTGGAGSTSASGTPRLLDTLVPRLAELQRRVVRKVLAHAPVDLGAARAPPRPLPRAPRGGARWRSSDGAAPGPGRVSPRTSRARGWRCCSGRSGSPHVVATTLAGLLVTATPPAILCPAPAADSQEARRRLLTRLAGPHLPQGAPVLCPRRSEPAGAPAPTAASPVRPLLVDARDGRYADDLVFSGPSTPWLVLAAGVAGGIAAEEGNLRLRDEKNQEDAGAPSTAGHGPWPRADATPGAARRDYDELRRAPQQLRAHRPGRATLLAPGTPPSATTCKGCGNRMGLDGPPARAAKLRAAVSGDRLACDPTSHPPRPERSCGRQPSSIRNHHNFVLMGRRALRRPAAGGTGPRTPGGEPCDRVHHLVGDGPADHVRLVSKAS